jgi:hypothetical protein
MSADLFAVFGTPDVAPSREQLDERWAVSQDVTTLKTTPQSRQVALSNVDVLFDADEAEAEDDFGDFEDVEATNLPKKLSTFEVKQATPIPSVLLVSEQFNLLGLEDEPIPEVEQERPQLPSLEVTNEVVTSGDVDDWGDFVESPREQQQYPKSAAAQPTVLQALPLTALDEPTQHVLDGKDDGWDGFEDWNAEAVEVSTNIPTRPSPELPDEPRPTNIPPPTIVLQLLPEVFQSIQDLAKVSHKATEIDETAASIVTVFAVSARIIAGRSLRRKRDTYLAQSTRIGPSVSGARSGGMKLTAVNKSEAIREEREAADVCDAWSSNTHIFAGIVTKSEHRRPWMNLNIKMTPRPSPGFGTLEAKDPCALCGIKRDERIAGVDFDADDVFNEYWTEHWGHTDCKVFWYTYRDMLDQR